MSVSVNDEWKSKTQTPNPQENSNSHNQTKSFEFGSWDFLWVLDLGFGEAPSIISLQNSLNILPIEFARRFPALFGEYVFVVDFLY